MIGCLVEVSTHNMTVMLRDLVIGCLVEVSHTDSDDERFSDWCLNEVSTHT